jgi:hypothetical protein
MCEREVTWTVALRPDARPAVLAAIPPSLHASIAWSEGGMLAALRSGIKSFQQLHAHVVHMHVVLPAAYAAPGDTSTLLNWQ